MTRLLIVRHAQSEWNALGRWQGWADPPLSSHGRSQATTAGQALHKAGIELGATISSDLQRAAQSVALIAAHIDVGEVPTTDEGWREYRVGAWSGLTRDEIEGGWPGALARYDRGDLEAAPGGELRTAFDARLGAALDRAIERTAPGTTTLVVTHGGSIRAVGRILAAPVVRVGNLTGIVVRVGDGGRAGTPELVGTVDLLGPDLPALA